ncbi:MAG: hypothetical protein K8I29_04095 [Alphaproteobacteria bacterium]|uniref:Uncharacterized protein n=1 Tax=Candidatus Nitrobium versatile TaxID=2884831 RepID=A0A953J357_9BACT|nr:hypothetical protein [Candidatus Nitrobium versatile]
MDSIVRRVLILLGAGLMAWGYYHLFGLTLEESYVNRRVTASLPWGHGVITGRVAAAEGGRILLEKEPGSALEEVMQKDVITVEELPAGEYEVRRAVRAVSATVAGGFLIWGALFLRRTRWGGGY